MIPWGLIMISSIDYMPHYIINNLFKKGERNEINEDSMHTYASGSFHDSKSWLRGRNI